MASVTSVPWAVMLQNLRRSACDPNCPTMWEVPITWGNGNAIALVFGNLAESGEASRQQCLEIAHMMAAAPEMLSVLRTICDEGWLARGELEKMARAAISKAEGRS